MCQCENLQVHGLLLGYGIESKWGQLQSKKERQRILTGLEDHKSFGNAVKAVVPLFNTIDQVSAQVKKLENVIESLVSEDEDIELLMTHFRHSPEVEYRHLYDFNNKRTI